MNMEESNQTEKKAIITDISSVKLLSGQHLYQLYFKYLNSEEIFSVVYDRYIPVDTEFTVTNTEKESPTFKFYI
jgi:hypothetical protein